MISAHREAAFVSYVAARRAHLQRIAYLLTGSWSDAEDLVQITLMKLYGAWRRVGVDQPEAYARTVMLRSYLDERRRGWRRREVSVDVLPERPAHAGPSPENVDAVRTAMAQLAPRQRATIVLRYWLDLSVEQTAAELGCSTGTVKSQTAKAMTVLRQAIRDPGLESEDRREHGSTTVACAAASSPRGRSSCDELER